MKPTSKTLSWAFVIILLAVGIFTGLGVILMHKQPLVLQGQAEATEIRISGKLPGRIDTFFVQEGDWVHRGDTLVVINSPEVHAKYQQVNALEQVAVQQNKKIDAGTRRQIVATALQLWNKTKSDLTLAQTTYNRILTLYNNTGFTDNRNISEQTRLDADYGESFLKSLEIIEKEERNGCHPRKLGAAICKIVECTNPPFRTKVGPWIQVLFAKSKKWLPDAVMQCALRIFYAIK